MSQHIIYAHNEYSEGSKELAKALGIKRMRHEGSAFRGNSKKFVFNWGSHNIPAEAAKCKVLNDPAAVRINANKLAFFEEMLKFGDEAPRVPAWTTDADVAKGWVAEGILVVARTVLNGSSGVGIEFMDINVPDSFVSAPLYVQYVKKKDEYRCHFVKNKIIDTQRKALRSDTVRGEQEPNWRVRNLQNGFVFVREGVNPPADVLDQALRAAKCSGLDFGAIDLIYNEKQNQAYVLEINTAPGLQGSTITSYANAFKEAFL